MLMRDALDFIVKTKQPLMYFEEQGKRYRFTNIQHGKDYITFPYYCEENNNTINIKLNKSGNITCYDIDENKKSKMKIQ